MRGSDDLPLVPDLLRDRAAQWPERVALVVYGHGSLTYGGWNEGAAAVAAGLVAVGVGPGDRIGLVFAEDEWDEYAVAYVGVLKTGAAAVPVLSSLGDHARDRVFAKVGVRTAIHGRTLPARLEGGLSFDQLARQHGREAARAPIDPDAIADIIYTSGSTGAPKAVCASHGNLTHGVADPQEAAFSGPRGYQVHATPIGTSAGQKQLLRAMVSLQTVYVALPRFEPGMFVRAVQELKAGKVALVPATATALIRSDAVPHGGMQTVRRVSLASAAAPKETIRALARAFPHAEIYDLYGSTEAGRGRLFRRRGPEVDEAFRPMPPTQVRVVDEAGQDVAPGAIGHILLFDPAPPRWYLDDAESSGCVFLDRWTRTGDLGILRSDGGVELRGRADEMLNVGGLNVAPGEVEEVLVEHPAVSEAVAAGVADPVLGQVVGAVVVATGGQTAVEVSDVRSFALARLGRAKAPRRIVVVESVPRLPSAKVDRRAAARLLAEVPASGDGTGPDVEWADGDEVGVVLGVVRAVLDRPLLGPDDDVFHAGLDSLTALELAVKLGDAVGVEINPWWCFEQPTPRLLAEAVDVARSLAARPADPWSTG